MEDFGRSRGLCKDYWYNDIYIKIINKLHLWNRMENQIPPDLLTNLWTSMQLRTPKVQPQNNTGITQQQQF